MLNKDQLIQAMLASAKATESFTQADLAWIELILKRNDGQSGHEQLKPFIMHCEDFLDRRDELLKKEAATGRSQTMKVEFHRVELYQALFAAKSLYYKQKKVMIGVAQRRRHPVHGVPNLFGFIAPQPYRVEVETVYGLGYAESREYLAKKAIETNCTHILFVDDDILLPLNALEHLLSANELFVAANYYKRNVLLESTHTTIAEDKLFGFKNIAVEAKQDDYTPIAVNACGLGATLIDIRLFDMLPKPWFKFIHEELPGGQKGRLLVGEDSALVQTLLMHGITPKSIPGLVALHVDFATGNQYGPEWLVEPMKRRLKPEFVDKYCTFACDTKELVAPDNDDVFKAK